MRNRKRKIISIFGSNISAGRLFLMIVIYIFILIAIITTGISRKRDSNHINDSNKITETSASISGL